MADCFAAKLRWHSKELHHRPNHHTWTVMCFEQSYTMLIKVYLLIVLYIVHDVTRMKSLNKACIVSRDIWQIRFAIRNKRVLEIVKTQWPSEENVLYDTETSTTSVTTGWVQMRSPQTPSPHPFCLSTLGAVSVKVTSLNSPDQARLEPQTSGDLVTDAV